MHDLAAQLESLMQTGTEADVRAFVAAHFKEFPEETQQALAVQFLSDALDSAERSEARLVQLKEDAAEVIRDIEDAGV